MNRDGLKMGTKTKNLSSLGMAAEIELIASGEGVSYLDAICHYCEIHGIETETLALSLHQNIIEKLELEAQKLNLVAGVPPSRLPFQ